ncbi:TolC family protein [Dokdonella immobilis]|uniref:Outer membrane protein TolC n=1 Tax=Dokdonella immobilis TaxID=578942 RepID=A0A1I5AQT9_9GAMM|nr:TolC family protein [Dokdonella immobilis]SFN64549.1 Outer membrane protein TolC [Dokdonella immobilis]
MASPHDPSQTRRLPARPRFSLHQPLRHAVCWLLAGVLWTLALPVIAAEPIPGHSLESIRAWVLEHNPELRALDFEAQAAEARILPAGALPDPMASVAIRGLNPDKPWRSVDAGREFDYALRQRLPLWGKRDLARTAASQDAVAVGLDRLTTARDLLADAEAAYARYWHADQAVAVLDRRIALIGQIEEMARVRYALGRAAQQDAIRAQVEQTSLQRERIERIAAKEEAVAMLNAVLGRRADAALATPNGIPGLVVRSASLADALGGTDAHPAVRAQQARAEAAHTNVALQRRNRFPDITVGVGAMQIGNGIKSTELMLEVEIPFQQHARRERERESRLLEDAALARMEATLHAVEERGASAWAQWTSARERRGLIENTLLPQADATWQSALASYQVGEVDFGTLLEALNEWQGADLARVDALRDELLGAAAVRAIEGEIR